MAGSSILQQRISQGTLALLNYALGWRASSGGRVALLRRRANVASGGRRRSRSCFSPPWTGRAHAHSRQPLFPRRRRRRRPARSPSNKSGGGEEALAKESSLASARKRASALETPLSFERRSLPPFLRSAAAASSSSSSLSRRPPRRDGRRRRPRAQERFRSRRRPSRAHDGGGGRVSSREVPSGEREVHALGIRPHMNVVDDRTGVLRPYVRGGRLRSGNREKERSRTSSESDFRAQEFKRGKGSLLVTSPLEAEFNC